jgi:hypothetical protein
VQMATYVFKWLIYPVFAMVFSKDSGTVIHPFHVSVTEINHNSTERTLEISCKIFTDDFENVLAQNYHTKTDLIHPADQSKMDTLVKKYMLSHLSIKVNGKPVALTYIGFEHESEAVYSYAAVENVNQLSQLVISNTLMYDLFTDQVNIVHVIVGGKRKSTKLDYPAAIAEFSY